MVLYEGLNVRLGRVFSKGLQFPFHCPREGAAISRVIEFVLVGVRFALESHGVIGLLRTSEACPLIQPFRYVYQIKAHVSRFAHLCRVDGFMAEGAIGDWAVFLPGKDVAEKVYGCKASKGYQTVVGDFHVGKKRVAADQKRV